MLTESVYLIPCPNCKTVTGEAVVLKSHIPEVRCPDCGVRIEVQGWGKGEAMGEMVKEYKEMKRKYPKSGRDKELSGDWT